ncbi:MAG: hypothetical protein AAFY88_18700, partial [Acidobacteriota bacterium]
WAGASTNLQNGLGPDRAIGTMESLEIDGVERIYVGGTFLQIGAVVNSGVAAWDGTGWTGFLGPEVTPVREISALAAFAAPAEPKRLVAAGRVLGGGSSGLATWDGAEWIPLGDAGDFALIGGVVESMLTHDFGDGEELFVAGSFAGIDGLPMGGIASWDGTSFSALGTSDVGVDGTVTALAIFDDGAGPALFVGGDFQEAGGVASPYLARWDGSSWSAPSPDAPDGPVHALEVYDDGGGPALFVGGNFDQVGALLVRHIAKWDGQQFSSLPGPIEVGVEAGFLPTVFSLEAFDPGDGERLWVSGRFERAGGSSIKHLATWDGSSWGAPLGATASGISPGPPEFLATFELNGTRSLFAAGAFSRIYGLVSYGVGEYRLVVDIFEDGFESGDTGAWSSVFP